MPRSRSSERVGERVRTLLPLLLGCHPGCHPPVPAPPVGDPAVVADSAGPADTAPPEDSADPPQACDAPTQLIAAIDSDAGLEAGRAMAWTTGERPQLAVGVPEAADGAGAVRLLPADGFEAPLTLLSSSVQTVGRSLSAGPAGALAVAGRVDDGAVVWWLPDPLVAPADLDAAASYMATGDGAGVTVTTWPEHDDGAVSLLVGLPRASAGGGVWVLPPPNEAFSTLEDHGVLLSGEYRDDYAGASATDAGDLDGDGVRDLAVGAFGHDTVGVMAGRVYLVRGPLEARSLADADGTIDGAESWDLFGWAIAGGHDFDLDGRDDLVVGAPGTNGAALSSGAAHVFVGPGDGPRDAADAWSSLLGADADARVGWSVATLAGAPARVAVGGPGLLAGAGGAWVAPVGDGGTVLLDEPLMVGDGRDGAGGTLVAGDPMADGCDLLAVGAPDGGRVWIFGPP